jgi:hypothetical protein
MFDVKESKLAVFAGIHNPVPWQVHLSGRLRDIWYLIRQLGRKVQQVQDGAGAEEEEMEEPLPDSCCSRLK